MISINTPYFIGSITAMILHQIIPMEVEDPGDIEAEEGWTDEEEEAELVAKDEEPVEEA